MQKKDRYKKVIDFFSKNNPKASTELNYSNPYQLMVAVILSAQCTDKRVNMITPALFERYKSFRELSKARIDDIFQLIKSCSYPRNKSRHLLNMAKKITDQYNEKIPQNSKTLQEIPGIGRKSANVIAVVLFNEPVFPVDTHVFRVAARIGLTTNAKTTLEAEKQLTYYFPDDIIPLAHHWLILHGRYVCKARKPICSECEINDFCKYFYLIKKHQ